MTTPPVDPPAITRSTPGEAPATDRRSILGSLALLAAGCALALSALPDWFRKGSAPSGAARAANRLSINPPSRSVKRRG